MNQNVIKMRQAQLTEEEIFVYLLIEGGFGYRELARALLVSHAYLIKVYAAAKSKIKKLTEADLL